MANPHCPCLWFSVGRPESSQLKFIHTFLQPALKNTVLLVAMNPVGYPAEVVPLQGGYASPPGQAYGPPGQPRGTVVQYTTVNIPPEPPRDHIIWSICCFAYANPCCLGLAALIYSIKARDRKMAGDMDGARHYGSTARCLNIFATILGSIIILTILIIIFVNVQEFIRSIQSMGHKKFDKW